jgi:AbrB family looped-hinge helix DNA binding protein
MTTRPPDKKRFYGSITVSERGQVVIPAEARRDFGIEVGDKLLVLGDLDQGLALVKASMLLDKFPAMMSAFQSQAESDAAKDEAV